MKFKVFIVSVFFICSLLPGISLAQNKVVVIPLWEGGVDADGDGWHSDVDCDDTNPDVHPNAGWQKNSAGGNVGWDWNCSGGVEKKYNTWREIGQPKTEAMCSGIFISVEDPVQCGETFSPTNYFLRIREWQWVNPEPGIYFCDPDWMSTPYSNPVLQECK